jgi:hypothetical protein
MVDQAAKIGTRVTPHLHADGYSSSSPDHIAHWHTAYTRPCERTIRLAGVSVSMGGLQVASHLRSSQTRGASKEFLLSARAEGQPTRERSLEDAGGHQDCVGGEFKRRKLPNIEVALGLPEKDFEKVKNALVSSAKNTIDTKAKQLKESGQLRRFWNVFGENCLTTGTLYRGEPDYELLKDVWMTDKEVENSPAAQKHWLP